MPSNLQREYTGQTFQRRMLDGLRFTVNFYGGWYVIDNLTGDCRKAPDRDTAIELARHSNADEG